MDTEAPPATSLLSRQAEPWTSEPLTWPPRAQHSVAPGLFLAPVSLSSPFLCRSVNTGFTSAAPVAVASTNSRVKEKQRRIRRYFRSGGYFVGPIADLAASAALLAIKRKPLSCDCFRTSASRLSPAATLPDAVSTSPRASCASSTNPTYSNFFAFAIVSRRIRTPSSGLPAAACTFASTIDALRRTEKSWLLASRS
jgi:hypothetical protein